MTDAAAGPYNPGMTTTDILIQRAPELAAIIILLSCSAVFSAAETALFSLTHEDLRKLSLSSSRSSRAIRSLLRDPQALLAAVLLGNMVVNLSIYGLSILIAIQLAEVSHFAAAVCGVVSLLAVILLTEASPKGIAVGRPVEVAHWVAWPLLQFFRVVRPVSNLIRFVARECTDALTRRFSPAPYVTRGELQTLIAMAEQQGTLSGQARGMIEQVVDLTNLRARELMTPRVDMPLFNVAAGAEGFSELVQIDRQERVLAYEGSADNVVGMLFTRDVLLHPEAEIHSLLRPVRFVPETQPAEALLRYFTHARDSVAIVVDEYGGTAGLVTIEHILEEVVGEIREKPRAEEPAVRRLDEDTYVLAGNLSTRDWRPLLGAGFDPAGVETLGGFVMSLLGRVPKEGESVERRGLRFVVEKMSGRRVARVRVQRLRREGEA
ncbi:MAG: hemolysin family protein [Candidatus Brocadiia bacterium]